MLKIKPRGNRTKKVTEKESLIDSEDITPFNCVMISDLHFDYSSNGEYEYRWKVWDQVWQIKKDYGVKDLFIMGDITDKKDNHPAELVNTLIHHVETACERFRHVYILKGNHDYLKKEKPYFDFLDGFKDNLTWITKPKRIKNTLWLPHTRNPVDDWKSLPFQDVEHLFLHQPFIGSVSSMGYDIPVHYGRECFPDIDLSHIKTVWSGDIHMPQHVEVGELTIKYIGTPYPIIHGDEYLPRAIVLQGDQEIDIPLHNIRKVSKTIDIDNIDELQRSYDKSELLKEDFLKLKVTLRKADVVEWPEIRTEITQWCADLNIKLVSIKSVLLDSEMKEVMKDENSDNQTLSNEEVLNLFSKKESLDEYTIEIGKKIIEGNV